MPTQSQLSTSQEWSFFENLNEGGQLKTKNTPPTQAQRGVVTNRGKKSPFKADVRLVTCVHGRMDESDSTPASLLVFEYHLACFGGNRRYKSVNTRLVFESQEPKDLEDEPFIKKYAPFKLSAAMDPVEIDYTETTKVGASAGASFAPANATADLSREFQEKFKIKRYAFGQAFEEFTDGKSGSDAIQWELQENKAKGEGVPDTFRLAVLLQRADTEKFTCTFTLNLHAGILLSFENIKTFVGITQVDDPIIFDPSLKPQGETAGISPSCLGKFTDQREIQSLSFIHLL